VEGYGEGSRAYRLPVEAIDGAAARVFREKDIPIQIALGNYDVGICSSAWMTEMQVRFPEYPVVSLSDLGVGRQGIYVAAALDAYKGMADLASVALVRIVSDFPNIAESFAMAARLADYRVQAVWGAAEALSTVCGPCT
jgi:ATP phosphoribosyltransferase